jgi:peptidoglycan/xylan/chitin deacetylase (PgdA/CDA1 family)
VRRVCLTIDTEFPDRPCADPLTSFDRLLEVLAERQTAATFFVVGGWAKANPDRVTAIRQAGHQIANHSYSHCNLSRLTAEGIVTDLNECRQTLIELGIETRPWFRAPFGEMGSDPAIGRAVERAGYRHVPWNVDSEDWRPELTPEQIADSVFAHLRRPWPRTATVLFHSWPDRTPRALALLLDRLAGKRATFATVAEAAAPMRSAAPERDPDRLSSTPHSR